MNINDVIALVRAGYTRDEIAALAKSAAPEQQPVQQPQLKPAPVQQPQLKPAPVQQPQPKPAPVQQLQPKPAPVQQLQPKPAPEQQPQQPAPEEQPQPAYDFLTLLSEKIDGLTGAIKAANIINSKMPEVKQQTAQDALASIIIPTYNKKEANK